MNIKFKKYKDEDFVRCFGTGKVLNFNLEKEQYECSPNCPHCDGLYKCNVKKIMKKEET